MNYAQNPHEVELVTAIQDWILTPAPGSDMEKWLLFDGAVLGEKKIKKVIKVIPENALQNIFFGTPLARYGLLSPHLVQLTNRSVVRNWLPAVLEHMNGVPAVSLLDAGADKQTLRRCLSWLGQARTDDGMDLYCRFADTRVTPSLMSTLVPDQLATLGHCIHEWRIVDRLGRLDIILEEADIQEHTASTRRNCDVVEQLLLSDAQFSNMMKAAEADEIFQMLCEGASDLVPDDNRGDFYVRLSRLVAAGRGQGLEKSGDIYQFSVIALATSDEFYRLPELNECWARMHARTEDFGSVVARWPDETWDALAITSAGKLTEISGNGENHE